MISRGRDDPPEPQRRSVDRMAATCVSSRETPLQQAPVHCRNPAENRDFLLNQGISDDRWIKAGMAPSALPL